MVKFIPFRAVRPACGLAEKVAALPYDVMTSGEARCLSDGNPLSFLHIDRAEIDLPECTDPYCPEVYARAKENLDRRIEEGVFIQDKTPRFYAYRLTMDGRPQTGLVGCASIDDYEAGLVKKHEMTRAEKEEDRVRHVDTLDANTGPIFLACRENEELSSLLAEVTAVSAGNAGSDGSTGSAGNAGSAGKAGSTGNPVNVGNEGSDGNPGSGGCESLCDFVAEDGVRHEVWALDESANEAVTAVFNNMDALYIADGHHRCAAAAHVGRLRREQNPGWTGEEEFNFFLAVVFPESQLAIMDYNRVVADLNGLSDDAFLAKLSESFEVLPHSGDGPARPGARHEIGMYLGGRWYLLKARPGIVDESDPVARLDVSILKDNVLTTILGIEDQRKDKRIDFIGGIRGLGELVRRVESDMKLAFAMYPTTMDELFFIADSGLIMPPKSTWFEPKLRSGLFIHKLSD